jgi:hypothetical protein
LLVAVILAAVGCFALVIGGHDVFVARGLGSRLFGALLAVAGLIMLIAAAGVFRGAGWHVALSLVGSFAALLVGLALLLAQLDAGEQGPWLFVWVAVIVASAAALVMSLGPGAPQVSSAVRRVQIVAVAGIALGVAQFVFTTVYGPAPAGPHLEVTSALERVGQRHGLDAVRARITLKNSGQRSIVVVDGVYRVVGGRLALAPDTEATFREKLALAVTDPLPGFFYADVSRDVTAESHKPRLVQAGQVINRGFWFEPGESWTREFVLYVPHGAYDLLSLSALLTVGEHRYLDLDQEPTSEPSGRYTRIYNGRKYVLMNFRWSIPETSWVRSIIRGKKVLWSRWKLAGPKDEEITLPFNVAYVDKEGAEFDPWLGAPFPDRITRLSDQYGVISTLSHAELSLFPR